MTGVQTCALPISNTEFLYVFVKKFKWENPLEHEQAGGHPIPGRVYRASKNVDTDTYRLFAEMPDRPTLLVFGKLKETIEGAYTSDFKVISPKTLLDFDITDEDLDSLLEWLKSDNKNLKEVMGFNMTPVKIEQTKTNEDVADFIDCAKRLYDLNPSLLNSIHDYLHFAIEQEEESDEGPIPTTFLTLNSAHGTGANVIRAVEKLSVYVSDDRRVNLDLDDLYGAITNLLTEGTNRTFNNI